MTQRKTPTLSLFAGASVVVAGDDHTLATKTVDGSLWGWGINNLGQLGVGTTTNTSTPVQIPTGTPVTFVTGGEDFTLVILTPP